MPDRSYARYLAPLALVVFALALIMVVTGSGSEPAPSASGEPAETQPASEDTAEDASADDPGERRGPRRYRVEPGDTPSTIAEKTGVPLERIEELNPEIDPQQLTPGQRIRLR